MRRIFISPLLMLLALNACASPPSPSSQGDKLTTTPGPKRYTPTDTDLQAAQAVLMELAQGARRYFESEQNYVLEEPWHPIPEPNYAGLPVPWTAYTFPGGPDFMMTSHAEPPQGGEAVMPVPIASQGDMQAALEQLNFTWPNYPTRFKYNYMVGPGQGYNATATITAQANFDTSNDALYTMKIRVDLHQQNQEVIIHPIETTPEVE